MDPHEVLKQLRNAIERWNELQEEVMDLEPHSHTDLGSTALQLQEAGADVVENAAALDAWLEQGGFSPWAHASMKGD